MRIHPTINSGKITEYPVNIKLEHKTYSRVYNILRAVAKGDKKQLEYYMSKSYLKNNDVDWEKITNEFWNNKDKDIVD
jgi:hypothetical protein